MHPTIKTSVKPNLKYTLQKYNGNGLETAVHYLCQSEKNITSLI